MEKSLTGIYYVYGNVFNWSCMAQNMSLCTQCLFSFGHWNLCSQTKADSPPSARPEGFWRVRRRLNPKPSLWIGQKSLLPSSSRSSSKNWLPLHKSTPSYHTFLWKSDCVPVDLCDESNLTQNLKDSYGFLFFFFIIRHYENFLKQLKYLKLLQSIYFPSKGEPISYPFLFHFCSSVRQEWRSKLLSRTWPVCCLHQPIMPMRANSGYTNQKL